MLSGAERTYRYEKRKRAMGLRKVHVMVPEDRADELKTIAARMRAEHAGRNEREKLLKKLVAAGFLGKKPNSKGGYYTYFGLEK